jgi:hypothetical protein
MPERSRTPKQPEDLSPSAFRVVQEATNEEEKPEAPEKNAHAVALGRIGGKKGGKARAAKLTPEQRRESAKRAAAARWSEHSTT